MLDFGSSALQLGSNLIAGAVTSKIQTNQGKELADYNNKIWHNQFDAQNARQDYLMHNAYSIDKQAKQQAGLSPLLSQGVASPSVSSPVGGSGATGNATVNPLDVVGMQKLQSEVELNKALAREHNANATGQETTNQTLGQMLQLELSRKDIENSNLSQYGKNLIKDEMLRDEQIRLTKEQVNETFNKSNVLAEQYAQLQMYNGFLPDMLALDIAYKRSNNSLTDAKAKEALASAVKLSAESKRIIGLMNLDKAQASYFATMSLKVNNDTTFEQWERNLRQGLGDKFNQDALKSSVMKDYFENLHNYARSFDGINNIAAGMNFENSDFFPNYHENE